MQCACMVKAAPLASTSRPSLGLVASRRNVATATPRSSRQASLRVAAHRVDIVSRDGSVSVLEVPEGVSILEAALDEGLDVSYDCKMGVCMTCPAKVTAGKVDQAAGMLDDEVQEKGYALLCVAMPQEDCTIQIIDEDELLDQVMTGGA